MEHTLSEFKLTQALLKTELSLNAMILTLYKAGFHTEHTVYDLSLQIMKLIGFSDEEIEKDELMNFYVKTMDEITEKNLIDKSENINEIAMIFYQQLLAEKKFYERKDFQ